MPRLLHVLDSLPLSSANPSAIGNIALEDKVVRVRVVVYLLELLCPVDVKSRCKYLGRNHQDLYGLPYPSMRSCLLNKSARTGDTTC